MTKPFPPKKALRLTLKIDAHDDADLVRILNQFALDLELGQIGLTSGCSSAGWDYRVERQENPLTPEEYETQLMAWWEADKAERRADS